MSPDAQTRFAEVALATSLDGPIGVVTIGGRLTRPAEKTTLAATLSHGGEMVARLDYHFRTPEFEADLIVPEAAIGLSEAPGPYHALIELLIGDIAVDAVERTVDFRREG